MNASLLVAAPLMIAAIVMAVRFVGCGIDSDPIWDGNGDENGNGDLNRGQVLLEGKVLVDSQENLEVRW